MNDIDPQIFSKPAIPVDEKNLRLKLRVLPDTSTSDLITQITNKIKRLQENKEDISQMFSKEIIELNNSGKKDVIDLSINLKRPLQVADQIDENTKHLRDQYLIIQKNIEQLMKLKDAIYKREMLKKLKSKALRLKSFYEIYEKLKNSFENRDFIQVSILYDQIKKLNVPEKMGLVNNLLSPDNFAKTLNNELFRVCQIDFSVLALFQCLLFIKDPYDVFKILTYNMNFNFNNIGTFDQLLDSYKYRFDVIYTILEMKAKANIVDLNKEPWDMPSKIWRVIDEKKLISIIKQSFDCFISKLDTSNFKIMSIIKNKWNSLTSLLYITDSSSLIAYKIVEEILNCGNIINSNNKNGLLYESVKECFSLYEIKQAEKIPEDKVSLGFIAKIIHSIIIFLMKVLVSNPFNQQNEITSEKTSYLKNQSKLILEGHNLKDLKINSNMNVELIQCDLININTLLKGSGNAQDSMMKILFDNHLNNDILSFFASNFLLYSIPLSISEQKVKECCSNDKFFNELNLKGKYSGYQQNYGISEQSLKRITQEYFNSIIPKRGFRIFTSFTEPNALFEKYYK